jgi:endonuclease-3
MKTPAPPRRPSAVEPSPRAARTSAVARKAGAVKEAVAATARPVRAAAAKVAAKAGAAKAGAAKVAAKAGAAKAGAAKVAAKAGGAVKAGAGRKGPAGRGAAPAGRAAPAAEVHARLAQAIPTPHCELSFRSPWELLVATILSAQSTDRTVNRVMPDVLARWPTPAALGAAAQEEVEGVVHATGFFRNKAKAIRETSRAVAERFGGEVPRDMEALLTLPGVARKTANVVLGTAYGIASGITVDVHAARVSQRLGLTRETLPEKIEQALLQAFPRGEWVRTGHRLVLHGRYVCTARAPACARCPLNELCPSREAPPEGDASARAEAVAREMASRAEAFSLPAVP